jgi:hypothetical protein
MRARFLDFLADDDGAVTADWVVLAAAICMSGMLALSIYTPALNAKAAEISTAIVRSADGIPGG